MLDWIGIWDLFVSFFRPFLSSFSGVAGTHPPSWTAILGLQWCPGGWYIHMDSRDPEFLQKNIWLQQNGKCYSLHLSVVLMFRLNGVRFKQTGISCLHHFEDGRAASVVPWRAIWQLIKGAAKQRTKKKLFNIQNVHMWDLSNVTCSFKTSQKCLLPITMWVVHNHIYHTLCGLCEPC